MKQIVTAWNETHEIEYMGERLEVKGRSPSQAAGAWREAARYKGMVKRLVRHEPNKALVPTRKSEALLLAAQRWRSA